jgi:hypothetical protein
MIAFMTEEQMEERLEEIQDEIDAYTKRIQSLEEELNVVIRCSVGNIVDQVRQRMEGIVRSPFANSPAEDSAFREQCRRFFEKYRTNR